jgi:hypothetical protein
MLLGLTRCHVCQELAEDHTFIPLRDLMHDLRNIRSRGPRYSMDLVTRLVLTRFVPRWLPLLYVQCLTGDSQAARLASCATQASSQHPSPLEHQPFHSHSSRGYKRGKVPSPTSPLCHHDHLALAGLDRGDAILVKLSYGSTCRAKPVVPVCFGLACHRAAANVVQ